MNEGLEFGVQSEFGVRGEGLRHKSSVALELHWSGLQKPHDFSRPLL